jgi:hypothetical protein
MNMDSAIARRALVKGSLIAGAFFPVAGLFIGAAAHVTCRHSIRVIRPREGAIPAVSGREYRGAYIDLYPIATGNIGALEGDGPGLANTNGRSVVESCLIDM